MDAGQRRFREELKQIPTVDHEVYGSCLAPTYPSQLLIALGQLASLPIGAWRGQASVDWGIWGPLLGFSEESLFPDFDGFALAHGVDKPFPAEFITDAPDV